MRLIPKKKHQFTFGNKNQQLGSTLAFGPKPPAECKATFFFFKKKIDGLMRQVAPSEK